MDQYLFPREGPSGEEYRKVQGSWNGNIPKMAHIFQEPLYHAERNIREIVAMKIDPTEVGDPLKEEGIQVRMGDCLIEGDILIRIEDLLEEEDILEEDCLMEEDPLMVEDSLMAMEDPLDPPVDKDHQVIKDLPDL